MQKHIHESLFRLYSALLKSKQVAKSKSTVEEILAEEDELGPLVPVDGDADVVPQQDAEVPAGEGRLNPKKLQVSALVNKLHVNISPSEKMMRLAVRCNASEAVKDAIQKIRSHCKAAMPHAEQPNQIVGADFV